MSRLRPYPEPLRGDLFVSLNGVERTLARLRRRTLIVALGAVVLAAADLVMVVVRP